MPDRNKPKYLAEFPFGYMIVINNFVSLLSSKSYFLSRQRTLKSLLHAGPWVSLCLCGDEKMHRLVPPFSQESVEDLNKAAS